MCRFKDERRSMPSVFARATVLPLTIAPAASVGPSVPSVPSAMTHVLGRPAISNAAEAANSWARPPFPRPVTVTVVSPPAITQHGRFKLPDPSVIALARSVNCFAATRASPMTGWETDLVWSPACCAARATASSIIRLLPTMWCCTERNLREPGFRVSGASPFWPRCK